MLWGKSRYWGSLTSKKSPGDVMLTLVWQLSLKSRSKANITSPGLFLAPGHFLPWQHQVFEKQQSVIIGLSPSSWLLGRRGESWREQNKHFVICARYLGNWLGKRRFSEPWELLLPSNDALMHCNEYFWFWSTVAQTQVHFRRCFRQMLKDF